MSDSNNNSNGGGIGFVGLLTILFIGLKLTHYIDWSWWWVWSPVWISGLVGLGLLFIFTVFFYLADRRR